MRWQQKLDPAERLHLKEQGMTTLTEIRRTASCQAEMRKTHPRTEPCWTCKFIAKKLGLEV